MGWCRRGFRLAAEADLTGCVSATAAPQEFLIARLTRYNPIVILTPPTHGYCGMGYVLVDRMDANAIAVRNFLFRCQGRPICAECLTRATGLGYIVGTHRALRVLPKNDGFREEETECAHCLRMRHTVMALWRSV